MKEKVKEFLKNNEEKELWDMIFDNFQDNGKEGVINFIKGKIEFLKKEYEEYKEKLIKQLGG